MSMENNVIIMYILICCVFVVLGIYLCTKELLKRRNCKSVITATVVDIYRKNRFKYPVFEYNVLGNTYVEKYNVGTRATKYRIGQEIEINYNSNKPKEFYIKGDGRAIFVGAVSIVLGILALLEIKM